MPRKLWRAALGVAALAAAAPVAAASNAYPGGVSDGTLITACALKAGGCGYAAALPSSFKLLDGANGGQGTDTVLAAAARAFVGSVNSGPAGAYAVYVRAEAKVAGSVRVGSGKSASVLGDPPKSPPRKWVVSSGEPFALPAGNGVLRLEYLTLPVSALRLGDGASLSVAGVV